MPPAKPPTSGRTKELAVSIVLNQRGYHVNLVRDGVPLMTFGPLDQPIDMPDALMMVALHVRTTEPPLFPLSTTG